LAEIPLSVGLERKLKVTKAKEMGMKMGSRHSNCLVEVDIRGRAIGLAKYEMEIRKLEQGQG